MRKFLLASVATLGTGGLIGTALAQTPVVGVPTQGQTAFPPAASPAAGANNNNNYQAPMRPGQLANPTPGTMVVHVNGKVEVDFQATWTSLDTRVAAAPAAGSLGAVVGQNGAGSVKVMPQAIDSFARIYLGADAMATNGSVYAMVPRSRCGRTSPARSATTAAPAPAVTPRSRRCSCAVPSPTSPASNGASCASGRPTA